MTNNLNTHILKLLLDSKEHISGERISQELGISRAAVNKRINNLKELGFEIESQTKVGYRLLKFPDILEGSLIEAGNPVDIMGHPVISFQEIDSTNDYAKVHGNQLSEGTLVISESQQGGRGRRGRSFLSEQGMGIFMSLILKPDLEPGKTPVITGIGAAAMIKALASLGIQDVCIKWPNDLFLKDKKICGILTEMSGDIEKVHYVVMGIGINVNNTKFPDDLTETASSLAMEGFSVQRVELVWEFLKEFQNLYQIFIKEGPSSIISLLREKSCIIGKEILIVGEEASFTAIDLDQEGALVVQDSKGQRRVLNSGEISIRKK